MDEPPRGFLDRSALPPFPAAPSPPRHRSAWALGAVVTGWVTLAGAVLCPVVGAVGLHLAALNPLVIVLGVVLGAAAGLATGVVAGAVAALVAVLSRASGPDDVR